MTGRNTSWSGQRTSYPASTRARILRRYPTCACPGCAACTANGCTRPSTIADHEPAYVDLVRAGLNPNDERHGRGMCNPCHDIRTRAQAYAGRTDQRRKRTPRRHPADQ